MYLIKRTNGIYYVEYTSEHGKKKRISSGSKDKTKAEIFLKEFKRNKLTPPLQEAIHSVESTITVKDFFSKYKLYIESSKSKKYSISVEKTIEFFQSKFGKSTLDDLLSRDIEQLLITKYQSSKYSASTHFRNLRAAFNKGIEWNYISKNPVSKIKLPKIPKNIPKFIGEDELNAINEKAISVAYSNIFLTAFYTGMRRGEILSLRWNNINFENNTIHIENTLAFNTKNKKDRIVPMHPKIIELVRKLDMQKHGEFVFTKLNGFPFYQDVITRQFKQAVRAANLDDRIHFHSLRHSFASNLVRKGVPIIVVKELLGHEDISTTMIYSHVRRNDLVEAVNQL